MSISQISGHYGEAIVILPKERIDNYDKLKIYLNQRIQILYAGVIAESMNLDRSYNTEYALNEWRNGGGMIDYAKVRELTHVLRNITYTECSNEKVYQQQLETQQKHFNPNGLINHQSIAYSNIQTQNNQVDSLNQLFKGWGNTADGK